MIYSMTGFGRAENNAGDKTFLIDIRALNGKQFDVRLNIPSILRPFEIEIRNLLSEHLFRGSVECSISLKQNGSQKPVSINTELAKSYYKPVAEMAKDLSLTKSYLKGTGLDAFCMASLKLLLGEQSLAIKENRACSIQSLSGTGALRIGLDFLYRNDFRIAYVSSPTWGKIKKMTKAKIFKSLFI